MNHSYWYKAELYGRDGQKAGVAEDLVRATNAPDAFAQARAMLGQQLHQMEHGGQAVTPGTLYVERLDDMYRY